MNGFTENARFLFGTYLKKIDTNQTLRKLYLGLGAAYVKSQPTHLLENAWIRRSTVTKDFFPLMSDIDLTIVIKHSELKNFIKRHRLKPIPLIKDVQILSTEFFSDWMETGGFRNRQFSSWKVLLSKQTSLHSPHATTKEFLAFELGYEVYLLYKQLQFFLKRSLHTYENSTSFSLNKLLAEIERTRLYWITGDAKILALERSLIHLPNSINQYLLIMQEYWSELYHNLHPSLQNFSWQESILIHDSFGITLNVEIEGKKVFIIHRAEDFLKALAEKPDYFVLTKDLFMLIKGIGIQEQTLLNELAVQNIKGLYFRFNRQRLAHDLLGAMILAPYNTTQLYFCFLNIQHFYFRITKQQAPHWEKINHYWLQNGDLAFHGDELEEVCLSYLDLLVGLTYTKLHD